MRGDRLTGTTALPLSDGSNADRIVALALSRTCVETQRSDLEDSSYTEIGR